MSTRRMPDGMEVRPGREGYYANFQVGGQRVRRKLGTDFAVACELLAELKARAYRSQIGSASADYPLAELREHYLAHCRQQLAPVTVKEYERHLQTVLASIGADRVSQLTTPAILTHRKGRLAAGKSPRTVNAEVGTVQAMLAWAAGPAKLVHANPLAGLQPLPHKQPKESRPLTEEEVPMLLAASSAHWRDVWYALLVTGLRCGELAGLQFSTEFLDWKTNEIIVPAWLAKNRQARRVPMDADLIEIIRRLELERPKRKPGKGRGRVSGEKVAACFSSEHIFVSTCCTVLTRRVMYSAFLRCLKRAGIDRQTFSADGRLLEHVTVHSLRKTFATSLISNGADPKAVQELLGHKTLVMTMTIYTKMRSATKRTVIGRLPYGGVAAKNQEEE